ncbi:hypothetical protein Nepgr_031802 [Nepenthes gracilis]|uniref:RanBP2-type domain-containing protein n=1 Tax=Nepenthes gracilis TaxID=150966 RepID=A0AAD3TIZ3_NEPGR|nr:hypothetical protein Nepgr_031802 [Nepenthes gracilis]
MATATARFFLLLSTPVPFLHPRISLLRLASCHSRFFASRTSRSCPLPPSLTLLPLTPVKPFRKFHSHAQNRTDDQFVDSNGSTNATIYSHPWPEWSKFVDRVRAAGYFDGAFDRQLNASGNEFVAADALPDEFVRAANACMAFALDHANILGSLSRKDIVVIVENGSPFLFKNALESTRRMKAFVNGSVNNVWGSDKPTMVDLMRFLLSYASTAVISCQTNNAHNREVVESSIRNLFVDLANVTGPSQEPLSSGVVHKQFRGNYGQTNQFGQNIEMKRGDWICRRCSFMNFARNMKCLECEEPRPKRQLAGGEWECPQCDFFNYGRNLKCLRCDCKKPGMNFFQSTNPVGGDMEHNKYSNNAEIDKRLAENEEKAQRWFNKISQLENTSNMSSALADADEDFPEIMPLRKGVNRFVVSTRKTPLERRLADEQYRRNVTQDVTQESNDFRMMGVDKNFNEKISQSLNNNDSKSAVNTGNEILSETPSPASWKYENLSEGNSSHVTSTSFPEHMIGDKTQSSRTVVKNSEIYEKSSSLEDKQREQAEKSERWFKRIAELHDVKDLPSALSNEDIPEVMPMRKGENRFVVSKKKDRSLTSPLYKRRMAMEQQAGSKDYVPFVPFPPDYFAKDKQPTEGADSSANSVIETSPLSTASEQTGLASRKNVLPLEENQQTRATSPYPGGAVNSVDGNRMAKSVSGTTNNVNQIPFDSKGANNDVYSTAGNSGQNDLSDSSSQPSEKQNNRDPWKGRSLEGSAVKEPDPLDMSEEAKAERWFRRVAQIKDISELSQIPDEDFPSIMPMRKGVNRFVVSKRKTPLERRLTSSQYRRNLPVVNSDPPEEGK